jgi:hypothetical protein
MAVRAPVPCLVAVEIHFGAGCDIPLDELTGSQEVTVDAMIDRRVGLPAAAACVGLGCLASNHRRAEAAPAVRPGSFGFGTLIWWLCARICR